MWIQRRNRSGRTWKFFRINFSHDSLGNYFQTNFAMMQHHKYSLTELDNMIPWEKQIYIDMLVLYLEEEKERLKEQNRNRK